MKKVVLLTMDSLEGFECYDHLLFEPLSELGWQAEEISWRKDNVNWDDFDAVIVRSTWDYQSDPQKFLLILERINRSSAVLFNDLATLKWNMNKTYLADLKKRGVDIVPTVWDKKFSFEKLLNYFNLFNREEIIIKPNISANADNTFYLKKSEIESKKEELENIFESRDFMAQPFMQSILSEGEYSFFYFGGQYSHTILKTPKPNDFRVQEEHGGLLKLVNSNTKLQNIGSGIIKKLTATPLYARVDLVRDSDDNFLLMELELIEPSLYFNMDVSAARKFASIFNLIMEQKI